MRKLKALGLTESLEVGYRLSPRGRAYLPLTPNLGAIRLWADRLGIRDDPAQIQGRSAWRRATRRSQRRLASSSQVTASAKRSVVAT